MTNARSLMDLLDRRFPPSLAEPWDNPGLQVGDPDTEISRVLVALDPTPAVIDEAERRGAQFLLTHHPLVFEPLERVDTDDPTGAAVAQAFSAGVVVFACHTNADVASPGVSDALAASLGVKAESPLEQSAGEKDGIGLGRVGRLDGSMPAAELLDRCFERLGGSPRLVGDGAVLVETIAVCGGSGGNLVAAARSASVDALVTGDVKHHQGLEALTLGLTVIDAGHFATEWPWVRAIGEALTPPSGEFEVLVSQEVTDPFAEAVR